MLMFQQLNGYLKHSLQQYVQTHCPFHVIALPVNSFSTAVVEKLNYQIFTTNLQLDGY
jgi:hypothetical protein